MNWAASLPPQKTSYPQVFSLDSQVTFFEALKIQWFPPHFSSVKDDSERKERKLLGRLKILCFVNWFKQETCAGRSRITPLKFNASEERTYRFQGTFVGIHSIHSSEYYGSKISMLIFRGVPFLKLTARTVCWHTQMWLLPLSLSLLWKGATGYLLAACSCLGPFY